MISTIQAILLRRRQPGLVVLLKNRLIICVGVLAFCLLLSSAISVFIAFNQQQLGEQKVSLHDHVGSLLQAMVDQETGLRGYITTANTTFLAPFNSGRTNYTTSLQRLQGETASTDFQRTATTLRQVQDRAAAWSSGFADVQIANMQDGNVQIARADQTNTQGKSLFDALRQSVAQLQQASDSDLATLQSRVNIINLAALASALLLTIIVVIWLWRTFIHFTTEFRDQLEILKETATDLGGGNLAVRVEGVTDTDLNDLGETFNTMASTLQTQRNALRDRDILEQVSQLNTILTGSLDLTELIHNFLQCTFALLDVQMATLYLYNSRQKQLTLFTSRGVQKEQVPASFALGEGLIGRVALDQEPLMVTHQQQADTTTFQVKTMMGVVLPSSLYHLPLMHGNELLGVLAVGSIYPMSEQARNVLQVVVSNVAAAVSNALAYEHIQQQAEELVVRAREQERSNLALRQQRDELSILNGALEEANRARSQFLSRMSHELRTPLTSIIGFSQMLLRTSTKVSLNERQTNNIERILKNAQHLLILINDVLDLSKVEAGRMDVNLTEVDLRALLTTVVEETRSLAVERGLSLKIEVQDDVPLLETDPLKVRQIILNLLSNAIKFTKEGQVTITASCRTLPTAERSKAEAEQVVIRVKDTGIGIASELQERIFDAFYQVDAGSSRSYGGTGLGLSIVRELATLLGGKVEVQSQPGQGTTFTVVLPVHARDRQSLQELRLNTLSEQRSSLRRNSIQADGVEKDAPKPDQSVADDLYLVVAIDDNPDVLDLISTSLEQSPYRVVGVQDATQAVSIVQELRPNAVTLDIMMPKVNGWQILHQLKSNPATAAIPVILLTVLEDRSAGYVLGADEYLVKPVAREDLLKTLKQLTTSPITQAIYDAVTQARTGETSSPKGAPSENELAHLKHILLVHHEQNIQFMVDQLVKEVGYSVKVVDSGQDVMAIVEQTSPDLVMMFVKMEEQLRSVAEQASGPSEAIVDDKG